jgi:hypothetical protein
VEKNISSDIAKNDRPILFEKLANKQLDQYEKNNFLRTKKKLILAGKSEIEATNEATMIARTSKLAFKKQYYACESRTLTPEIQLAAKKYTALTLAIGTSTAAYGFYGTNKDKLVEHKSEFFGKLSYEIVMNFLLSKISAGMASSAAGGFTKRYIDGNISSAKIGLIDTLVYSQYFGMSEDEARLKVEAITHDKDAMKDLQLLDGYIDKTGLIKKFQDGLVDNYRKILNSPQKELLLGAPSKKEIDNFSQLSKEDLEKPELKEKLVKAVLLEMNSGSLSGLLKSGDKGIDRWVNDRVWNATLGIPRGIAVGVGLLQVLCLGEKNPILSLGLATTIQFVNQLIGSELYYNLKKDLIGI